jgi:hypothetical protein
LFVGDSFIWALHEQLPWKDILEDVEVWFYEDDVFKGFDLIHSKRKDVNILRSIMRADYVVFYSSGHQWYKATYDFAEQALIALCVSDSLMESETQRIADSLNISKEKARKKILSEPYLVKGIENIEKPLIRNTEKIMMAQTINTIEEDKNWVEALKIQASIQGKTIDKIYDIEAHNILNGKPLLRDFTNVNDETIFNAKVNNLVKKWRGDVTMVDYLEKKAKDKNKDFETVIYEDARWVIRQEQNKQK